MHRSGAGPVILLLSFLVIFSPNAVASGSQEDRLDEVSKLINSKEYNEALLLLTDVLKKNPDRIDDVQGLLDLIRVEKEQYNDKYEELLETYGGDDVEAAYPIIKELEEMDPNPNEATRISLVLARETAGFVFNNNRWVEIMDRASESIANGNYDTAITIYAEGFDLSRDIFLDSGYGNVIVNEINSRAEEMSNLAEEFTNLYPVLKQKQQELNNDFTAESYQQYIESLENLYEDLRRAVEIRENLKDTAGYFIVQENNLRTNSEDNKEVHYLVYMDRLLNGRTTVDELEGITGSIELYWNSLYEEAAGFSSALSAEYFQNALSAFNSGDLDEAESVFNSAIEVTQSSIDFLDFGEQYLESDSQFERPGMLNLNTDEMRNDLFTLNQQNLTSQNFLEIITEERNLSSILAAIENVGESETFREAGREIKQQIRDESEILDELLAAAAERAESAAAEADEKSFSTLAAEIAAIPQEKYRDISARLLQTDILLVAALYGVDLADLERDYELAVDAVDESSNLIEGVAAGEPEADQQADFTVTYKYPDQALTALLGAEADVNNLIENVENLQQRISAEPAEVKNGTEVAAVLTSVENLSEKSRGLLDEALSLGDAAREQIFTAEKLKQEGEKRIEDSRLLTQRGQFASAKERLEQAAAKFDESLSYLEDPVLRNFRDTEIPRLYEEIQVAENNLVVRQVRQYLTEGKANYSKGDFPAAQSVLIKAQSRWSDTNIEPNPEVEYWLTLTRTALSVTSGRVIAQTDPLYTEMNQYLNQARADFQVARNEINGGNEGEAEVYFVKAEQSILYVQQFFPFNEEARVLNLLISQYRNPEQFNELFRNDFLEARRQISSNPQKAYIDLKDLEAISPDYPGLQAAITEAEYASGIKVRPPDPAKLTKSTELYDLAYDIVSTNVRSEFPLALSYLNEAISLNPNNDEAIRLKDRISTDVGGTSVAVMSSADQQRYEEAVSEFTAGNYLKARIIVENLLKIEVNQRNPKLIDLKERLERVR